MKIVRRIAGILLVLVILEFLLQIAFLIALGSWFPVAQLRRSPPFYEEDRECGWRLRPNISMEFVTREFSTVVKTNSLGFRDDEFPARFGKSTSINVVFVGDSFTFGWGVNAEDSYPEILKSLWKEKHSSRDFRVFNLGIPGLGLEQEAALVEKFIDELRPRLIIVQTWPLDWDILNSDGMAVRDHYLISRSSIASMPLLLLHARIFLYSHCVIFSLASKTLATFGTLLKRKLGRGTYLSDGFGLNVFLKGRYPDNIAEAQKRAFAAIKRMKNLAKEKGANLVLVIVPEVFQVYPEESAAWTEVLGISGEMDIERPNRELAKFCTENRICFLDLLDPFRRQAARNPERLYYSLDPHWNRPGHRLAARVIDSFLSRERILSDLLTTR